MNLEWLSSCDRNSNFPAPSDKLLKLMTNRPSATEMSMVDRGLGIRNHGSMIHLLKLLQNNVHQHRMNRRCVLLSIRVDVTKNID